MTLYSDYYPAGATASKVLRKVRAIPNEQYVWNHYWFEAYLEDFLFENYNKNQTIVHGCLLSESATDIIACTGGEVIIDGIKTTVATPSNVNVVVDGWTVLYIDAAGALISTVGSPLINTNIQGANAPDSAVLIGFAKRTATNFDVYPIQNFLDLRISQQLPNDPIFIGDASQVTAGTAKYTINTLPGTSVTDLLVFIDGAVNTLTADRVINCHAVMQSQKGSIDLDTTFKLTLSGANVKTDLIVTNSGVDKVEVTGAGSQLTLISDNDDCLNITVQSVALHNGNIVSNDLILEKATESEGAIGTNDTKAMTPFVSKSSQTAARNEGVVVKNNISNPSYQLDVTARKMSLFEDTYNTLRHINSLSVIVDITVNGIQGCPRISRTGTATSTAGAVVGVGTLFNSEYQVGDVLWFTGVGGGRILTITGDLNCTIEDTVIAPSVAAVENGGEARDTTYWLFAAVKADGTKGAYLTTRGPADTDIHTPSGYTHREWINPFRNLSTGDLEDVYSNFQGEETIGTIKKVAVGIVTAGWFECSGANQSRVVESQLWDRIGVTWGEGDGSTTFTLPDGRGKFFRGWDHGAGNDPDASSRTAQATGGNIGDNVGSVQNDAMQKITGAITDVWTTTPPTPSGVFDNTANAGTRAAGGSSTVQTLSFDSSNSTSPNAAKTSDYQTNPINANVMFIIKARN